MIYNRVKKQFKLNYCDIKSTKWITKCNFYGIFMVYNVFQNEVGINGEVENISIHYTHIQAHLYRSKCARKEDGLYLIS